MIRKGRKRKTLYSPSAVLSVTGKLVSKKPTVRPYFPSNNAPFYGYLKLLTCTTQKEGKKAETSM